MNKFLLFFFLFHSVVYAQKVTPFIDFYNYFENFHNGTFSIVDMQQIKELKAGDECAVYQDFKSNLVVYNGNEKKTLSNVNADYQVSDHLVAWKIGNTLNMWDDGDLRTLTYTAIEYAVKDSIIVYSDSRYNSVNVYWKGEVYPLYSVVDQIYMPTYIGENVVAFKDNGNFYKVFWNGEIYDIGIWNGDIHFHGGTDMIAFNDPTTRTFTVFDKGEFVEVESFFMNNYKTGRNLVVYEDLNGNLKMYKDGTKHELSRFSSTTWEVCDEAIMWFENNALKCFYKDETKTLGNFTPKDYLLKNDVIVYRNNLGGVSAFVKGINYEITNNSQSEYLIYGSTVLVKLFNNSYIVLHEGQKYTK